MMSEDFREVAKHLEPDAWAGGDGVEPFIISAAISLKRIADVLESVTSGSVNSIKELNVRANCDVRSA